MKLIDVYGTSGNFGGNPVESIVVSIQIPVKELKEKLEWDATIKYAESEAKVKLEELKITDANLTEVK